MEDDLEKIAQVLEVFRRIARDQSTYSKSLDEVTRQFSQALQEESSWIASQPGHLKHDKPNGADQAALQKLLPRTASPALLDRIKQACALTEKQMRLLQNTGVLSLDGNGLPILRDDPQHILPQEKAAFYLFTLGTLFGLIIGLISLEPFPGIWLLPYGLGFGIAMGSLISFVLGRSFLAYPALKKLDAFKPWLGATYPPA